MLGVRNVIGFSKGDEVTQLQQRRVSSRRMAHQAKDDVFVGTLAIDVFLENFSQPEWNAKFDRSTDFGRTSAALPRQIA